MSYIIDRRPNSKNKSTVNRQRFLRRYKKHIKRAVEDSISERSITDIDRGEKIAIPTRDVSEPIFHHSSGGERRIIHPGNKEFVTGDRMPRPKGGSGGGGSQASDSGEGMDEFQFQISHDEFLEVMFEGLELPNLVKRQLAGSDVFKSVRAGYSSVGNPNQINIVRSMRGALARRTALVGRPRRELREALKEYEELQQADAATRDPDRMLLLEEQIRKLRARVGSIPFLDTFDLKYNLNTRVPLPRSKAVMFCLMDVSGSMNQATKDIAKRFFILLYLFLQRNYDRTEVVFIRHHTSAKEVDEEEFFYSRETGGTIVSSALQMMKSIMHERYPAEEWNIYGAQASDGDNWNDDSQTCFNLLVNDIMPHVQHYSYVEITPREHQALWESYSLVKEQFKDYFAIQQIIDTRDIYPVFRELFHRKAA